MKTYKKSFWAVIGLIVAASATLAYVGSNHLVLWQLLTSTRAATASAAVDTGPVAVRTDLVQDKVLKNSEGRVGVSLTLDAAEIAQALEHRPVAHADLVIVLDRSGSMEGQKLNDARLAVTQLIDKMTPNDRLALVTYSNGVSTLSPLSGMDEAHRRQLKAAVAQIYADGGTNLGSGLKRGIQTLMQTPADSRRRRVILISDGLANQGITHPDELAAMASGAAEHNFAVSTVGVGYDFNEMLMTTLADHGAGSYYFLEDPNRFAQVFDKEFQATRNVVASGVEIIVPLEKGIELVNAGGYPIRVKDGCAVVHPGDLLSGQRRTLFLTFKVPTDKEAQFSLGEFQVKFNHKGAAHQVATAERMPLACVKDPREVMASIDAPAWSAQVVQEDYSQLKEVVAEAIGKGEKDRAMEEIREYETRNRQINEIVGSTIVADNLKTGVQALRGSVEATFAGPPAAVAEKKKQNSKALQYESYQIRRDKQSKK